MAKKFKGVLGENIIPPKPTGIIRSAMPNAAKSHLTTELLRISVARVAKLDLLAEDYGIPLTGTHYFELAMALAEEFVPGFSIAEPKGRPKRWPDLLRGALVVEMREIIESETKGKGPEYAARVLSKKLPWRDMVEELENPVQALLSVYKKTTREEPDLVFLCKAYKAKRTRDDNGKLQFDSMIEQYISEVTGKSKNPGN